MRLLLLVMIFGLVSSVSMASGPRYYSSQPNTKAYSYTVNTSSDQERCQAEANYMAANNISGHVWGTIGNFEIHLYTHYHRQWSSLLFDLQTQHHREKDLM